MYKEDYYFILKIVSVFVVLLFIFSLFGIINYDKITGAVVLKKFDKSRSTSNKDIENIIYAVQCGYEKCFIYKINKLNDKNLNLLNNNKYIGFGKKSYLKFLEISGLSDYYKFNPNLLTNLASSWWVLEGTKADDARAAHETGQGAQINYEDGQTECSQELASGLSLSRPCNPMSCDEENGKTKVNKGKTILNRMKGTYSDLFSSPLKNSLRSDRTSQQSNEPGFRNSPSVIIDPKSEKVLIVDTFSHEESYSGRGGAELTFFHSITVDILFSSSGESKVNIKHEVNAVADIGGEKYYVSLDKEGKTWSAPVLVPTGTGVSLLTGAPPSMTNEQANKLKEVLKLDSVKPSETTGGVKPKDVDKSKYCVENCEVVKEISLGVIRLKSPLVKALGAPSSNPRINPSGDNTDTTIFVLKNLKPKPPYNVDYDSNKNSIVNTACLDHCGRMTDCSSGKNVKAIDFNLGIEGVYAEVSVEKFLKKAGGYTDPQDESPINIQNSGRCGNNICENGEDEFNCPNDCSNTRLSGSSQVSSSR